MSRKRPHCKACQLPMQGHKRLEGNLTCPTHRSPFESPSRAKVTGRIMPCSLESNVWLSVFREHDHHGSGHDGRENIPHLSLSHSSTSRQAADVNAPEHLRLPDNDPAADALDDWPIAGIFSVLASEASGLVKQARSEGLHTRIVPKSVGFRVRSTGPSPEHDNRWTIVLGTDSAAVESLFEMRFRAGRSLSIESQSTRKTNRDLLSLVMAGALGGLAVWRLLCL